MRIARHPLRLAARPPAARRRALAAALVLLPTLLLGQAVAAPKPVVVSEAGRLHLDLGRLTKQANRALRPPARQLARGLPGGAKALSQLREPAATAEAELSRALAELRQMRALSLDPHYMPALVAVGRAYLAVSGRDPLTATTVNPDYLGLDAELAGSAAATDGWAGIAAKLARRSKRLAVALSRSKRRAHRLAQAARRAEAAKRRR